MTPSRSALAAKIKVRRLASAAILVGGVLLAASILGFLRVGDTIVEVDLQTSDLQFRLTQEHPLNGPLNVTYVGALSPVSIRISRLDVVETDTNAYLTAVDRDGERGSLAIHEITAKSATRVRLARAEAPGNYTVSLRGEVRAVGVSVRGPVRIEIPGRLDTVVTFARSRRITVDPAEDQLRLEFRPTSDLVTAFSPQVPLDSLDFKRRDVFGSAGDIPRVVSGIEGGKLYFEELRGAERELRRGQILSFESSAGRARWLELSEGLVGVNFYGTVSGLNTGPQESTINLMPTMLEWLSARHGLGLLWAIAGYAVALVTAVLSVWD